MFQETGSYNGRAKWISPAFLWVCPMRTVSLETTDKSPCPSIYSFSITNYPEFLVSKDMLFCKGWHLKAFWSEIVGHCYLHSRLPCNWQDYKAIARKLGSDEVLHFPSINSWTSNWDPMLPAWQHRIQPSVDFEQLSQRLYEISQNFVLTSDLSDSMTRGI